MSTSGTQMFEECGHAFLVTKSSVSAPFSLPGVKSRGKVPSTESQPTYLIVTGIGSAGVPVRGSGSLTSSQGP